MTHAAPQSSTRSDILPGGVIVALPRTGPVLDIPYRPPRGVPANQLSVPISRDASPSDTTLYDSPDHSTVYWLPRWRVLFPADSLPQITLTQTATGWGMTVHLEPYPADEVAASIGGAAVLPATIDVSLQYNLPASGGAAGGVLQTVKSASVAHDGQNLVVTFEGTDAADLDRTCYAMQHLELGTNLIVDQTITVAVQTSSSPGPPWHSGPWQPSPWFPRQPPIEVPVPRQPNTGVIQQNVPVAGGAQVDKAYLIGPVLHIPPFKLPPIDNGNDGPPPGSGGEPLYLVATPLVERAQSFFYPADRYPSIYAAVTTGTPVYTRTRHVVAYGGASFPYYQDPGDAPTFYFLPDAYRLVRTATVPHEPGLGVAFTPGATPTDIACQLTITMAPVLDMQRLADAEIALKAYTATAVDLQQLAVDASALNLSVVVPSTGAPPGGPVAASQLLSLSSLTDIRTFTVRDFQAALAAIDGLRPDIYVGTLAVTLDEHHTETIPVSVRIADTIGPVLDLSQSPADGDSLSLTLTNQCESAVIVNRLVVTMQRTDAPPDSAPAQATVSQLSAPLPASLPAGSSLTLSATATELPGTGALFAVVETPDLTINAADVGTLWDAVLGPQVDSSAFQRQLTVRADPVLFVANPSHPGLHSLKIAFQSGVAVTFDLAAATAAPTGTMLTSPVQVPADLRDYVVPTADPGTYLYKVTAITADGSQVTDPDWRSDNSDVLDVSLPAFP